MRHHNLLLAVALALGAALSVHAQTNGVNSSYSRFGMGLLCDPSQAAGRSMGGVGQGLRSGGRINTLNPASYSAVDSITFLFDVGMSLSRTAMVQTGTRQVAHNAAFDYVSASYRLAPRLGMALGFRPFSKIGYNFSQDSGVTTDAVSGDEIRQSLEYAGSGGVNECFAGVGWQPFRKGFFSSFSIGANVGFMWGEIVNATVQSFIVDGDKASSGFSSLSTLYDSQPRTWKADFALQFRHVLNPKNRLTVGATVGIGHVINCDAKMLRISNSGDSIISSTSNAYELPMTYNVGVGWEYAERLLVAADFTFEQWSECQTPQLQIKGNDVRYDPATGGYSNRMRFCLGAEYVPARYDRAYFRRINYRLGANYTSPYLKINGQDGPSEYGVTAGVGLPVLSARSYINVGLQWVHRKPSVSTMITENIYCINLGVTFNERWFQKWKFR